MALVYQENMDGLPNLPFIKYPKSDVSLFVGRDLSV